MNANIAKSSRKQFLPGTIVVDPILLSTAGYNGTKHMLSNTTGSATCSLTCTIIGHFSFLSAAVLLSTSYKSTSLRHLNRRFDVK